MDVAEKEFSGTEAVVQWVPDRYTMKYPCYPGVRGGGGGGGGEGTQNAQLYRYARSN